MDNFGERIRIMLIYVDRRNCGGKRGMILQQIERLLHVVHEGVDGRHGEGLANQSRSGSRAVHAIAGAGDVWERVQKYCLAVSGVVSLRIADRRNVGATSTRRKRSDHEDLDTSD